jgi:hypothetical protein
MIEDKETTQTALALQWGVKRWQLVAVINRYDEVVYPKIRNKLARFLKVPITEIGREYKPKRQKKSGRHPEWREPESAAA